MHSPSLANISSVQRGGEKAWCSPESDGTREHRQRELPSWEEVSQRQYQQQACCVSSLRQCWNVCDPRLVCVEVSSHHFEDGMTVIQVCGEDATDTGKQEVMPYRELGRIVRVPSAPSGRQSVADLHGGQDCVSARRSVTLCWQ